MQYVAQIDMNASIQPRRLSVGSVSKRRYGFVLDSRDFLQTTEKAVQDGPRSGTDHALEHLVEIANRSPEICVVLDGLGHMSAWGLENAGCKNKKPTTVFNVAHVDGMNVSFGNGKAIGEDYAQICVFAGRLFDSTLTILVHTFDAKIDWYDTRITELLDPSSRKKRAQLMASWTGHDANINSLTATNDHDLVFSLDDEGEGILWEYNNDQLFRKSRFGKEEEIQQSIVAADGKHVAFLHPESISIWNPRADAAVMIEGARHASRGRPKCLIKVGSVPNIHLALIDTSGEIEVWRLNLPAASNNLHNGANGHSLLLSAIATPKLHCFTNVMHISLIAGRPHDNEVAIAITRTGLVQILTCDLMSETHGLVFGFATTFGTNVNNPHIVNAVSTGKVAIVDETETGISIWDMNHGWLEYEQTYQGTDTIERLVWTTTQSGLLGLAIGLRYRIVILAQSHFSPHVEGNSWTQVQELRLRDFTTDPLSDLCWLKNASLLIGTANQLFVHEITVQLNGELEKHFGSIANDERSLPLIRVLQHINASLPIFHPLYVHHFILQNRSMITHNILSLLHEKLKYWTTGDPFPSDLTLELANVLALDPILTIDDLHTDNDDVFLDEEKAETISEYLMNSELPHLSASYRAQLGQHVRQVAALHQHARSVDGNALRYMYLSGVLAAVDDAPKAIMPTYCEVIFASRSASQDILVDHLTRSTNGKLTWKDARRSGLFMWLADHEAVRQQMEIIARNEYTNNDDRSPVECSLYYLALRKKNVLQGLWRMAPGLREQKNTLKLLANNFADPKWKTSALKNAYVLLSKRRFMYAAAFFLLGDSLKDAVNVCAHQLKDVQLAVAIARVYEGDQSLVLKTLLADQVLPEAVERGDRWCTSWVFGMLGMREKALQALVRPLHTLLEGVTKSADVKNESTQAKHWRNFEPTLAILYQQLRAELAKDPKASYAGGVTDKEEWDFVLRCATQYTRMGCDWLALDLVKNWEFLPRRTSLFAVSQSSSPEETAGAAKADTKEASPASTRREKPKASPTQFAEPSASSLLDSFGF